MPLSVISMKRIIFSFLAVVIISQANAQMKVGNNPTTINGSAVLDVESTDKGLLIPRVNLTSSTMDLDGVAGQATGLLVYNIGSTLPAAFYYWNGIEWRGLTNYNGSTPTIAQIDCNTAQLTPNVLNAGTPYSGLMTVNYSGGNGGTYPDGTAIASAGVTGLTATLLGGTLNVGSGKLTYQVSGTPVASLAGTGCTASVGMGNAFTIGERRTVRVVVNSAALIANGGVRNLMTGKAVGNVGTTNRQSAYELAAAAVKSQFLVINGLRMDFLESYIDGELSPKFFNTTASSITYTISALSTSSQNSMGANTVIAPNAFSYFIEGDDLFSSQANIFSEFGTAMLTFPNGEWYSLIFHATNDGLNYQLYFTAERLN